MRFGPGLAVIFSLLMVIVMASDLPEKAEKKSDTSSLLSISDNSQLLATEKDSSLQPHKRSKRTIGHIFDMFKNMMDGLFGGGKKKKPRRPSSGYGRPQRPQPPRAPRPSYGRPPPRPPQPPPPPRNPLSGGYANGNRPQPPRRPQPPPPRAPVAPNPDSYGSPQAPPVGNPDSYGSPQAPPVGNPDSYGSPQAAPVGPSYSAQPQAPRAPQRPQSDQFGPSSVFYMIPAPNLATEGPPGGGGSAAAPAGGGDSYGSPQASPVGGNEVDSYGSPQAAPVGEAAPSAPDSYSGPDSFGNPQPEAPAAPAPVNPFISQYNNAAPLPVTDNDLSGQFVEEDTYGAPEGGEVAPAPITDIDLPEETDIIVEGRGSDEGGEEAEDLNEIAPEGTDAPDLNYDEDAETFVDLRAEDEELDESPEGEVISTQVDEIEGETSPLFEDLRNVAFTSADTVTEPIERDPITIDLSGGVVDLTNGLDDNSGLGDTDFTLNSAADEDYAQDLQEAYGDTTPVPSILGDSVEYEYADEYESDYFGDENVPPELPQDLTSLTGAGGDLGYDYDHSGDSEALEDEGAEEATAPDYGTATGAEEESFGQPESSDLTDSESEYEYYYDYEEDYEYDPEQLPDEISYSPATESSPLTTASGGGGSEDSSVTESEGANFISVPLMIEEVSTDEDTAPVILAGTSGDLDLQQLEQATYGGRQATTKRRAPHAFHPVFQGWTSHQQNYETPQSKRQADWSQRVASARRNRVWRQFNLD